MEKKGRVFITNYSGHSHLNLAEFSSEILNITEGSVNIFDFERLEFDIKQFLFNNDFDENDFIVFSGNVVINFTVGQILAGMGIMTCPLLVYNPKQKKYIEIKR